MTRFLDGVTAASNAVSKKLTDDKMLIFIANEVLQLYMAEMNEDMRNLYLAGYSMPKTSEAVLKRRSDMMHKLKVEIKVDDHIYGYDNKGECVCGYECQHEGVEEGKCGVNIEMPSEICDHLCHKTGFMGFIWKIVRVILKLFRMNPVCECGVTHW